MTERFGDMFKRLRIESGLTLRAFCLKTKTDPGNISKLERGRAAPPESDSILRSYAEALGLVNESDSWNLFFDLAASARGRVPSDLLEDEQLMDKLPVLFRVLRGTKTSEGLDALVEKIRKA